jgi:hypothetical protein
LNLVILDLEIDPEIRVQCVKKVRSHLMPQGFVNPSKGLGHFGREEPLPVASLILHPDRLPEGVGDCVEVERDLELQNGMYRLSSVEPLMVTISVEIASARVSASSSALADVSFAR